MANFVYDKKATRVSNAVAAGTTAVNSSSIDMAGFTAATFIVSFGAITATAVTSVKIQVSDDDAAWSDLTGSSVSVADDDDNQVVMIESSKVRSQYLRCVVSRGTANSVVDGIVALQYGAAIRPVAQDSATVVGVDQD